MRFICAEKPPNPARKLEYGLSVPPLARTILDSLFNVVFLSIDLPAQMEWFLKSGWRELYEEQQRYQLAYGKDPEWTEWLDQNARLVGDLRERWNISSDEVAQPKLIKWWPNPGKMIRSQLLDRESRDYLQYLNDWFYRQLSSWSHLSVPGLMVHGAPFVYDPSDREERDERLDKYRSDCFVRTLILAIALLSEINILLSFDVGARCAYLWTTLGSYVPAADELYQRRYSLL